MITMKKVYCFWIYLLVFLFTWFGFSNPIAYATSRVTSSKLVVVPSFSTNPAAVGGTITICNGQSITYTDTSTGVNAGSTYAWSFAGGTTTAANTAGPHTITYPTAGNYTTILTVDGISSSINVVVTSVTVPTLTIANTGTGYSTSVQNGVTVFTRCGGSNIGIFNFVDPNSASYPVGTTFNIDWGDSSPSSTTLGSHTYPIGIFQLAYTVNYPGGCTLTTNYNVFVGSPPPTVTISGSGATACNPNSYQFAITSSNNTIPGTTYTITVNDGSAPIVFPNGLPTNPYVLNYHFPNTSCGNNSTINNSVYADSYSIQVVASNPCSPQGTFTSIGPIRVSLETDPDFSQSAQVACVESTVTFTDTSDSGENVDSFGCNPNYGMYWEITPNTGFTLATGSTLGSSNGFTEANNLYDWTEWTDGTTPLNVIFNQAGDYTIKMITGNDCGMNEIEHTICITPAVVADFNFSPTTICAPATITPTNTSSTPLCSNTNNYNWQVTQTNPQNCPGVAAPGWTFSSGTATSFEPGISFTSPGVYEIQLTTSLQTPVPGALCVDDVQIKTITIKDKPSTILTASTICEGDNITLTPVINNCYATQAVTYFWDFGSTPPTTISSTTSPNPTLGFTNPGTYNYTLTLTNECGSRSYTSSVIVNPKVQITASGPTATCLNSNIQLTGTLTGGVTTGYWVSSVPNGTFYPNANTLSPTYSPPPNYTGTIVFTFISDDPIGPCPPVSENVIVEFNSSAVVDAGDYPPLCKNAVLTLNGTVGGAASSGSWTSSNGGVFSNPNALNSTFTPPVNFVGTITLTLTTDDPIGPCTPAQDTVILTIIPTPTINTISNSQYCDGTSVGPITFTGINATSFTWTNSNPLIGLSASGSGAIGFTATNTSASPIIATITVTPINSSGGTDCPGIPTSFTIIINPSAQVNTVQNIVVCNGSSIPTQVFSTLNTGGTTEYSWSNSNNSIGLGDSGTGDLPPFTALNTTTIPKTATITVTPTYTNNGITCTGVPTTFTITVNPTAQIQSVAQLTACHNQLVTVPFSTINSVGTTNYNWNNTNTDIGLAASGSGDLNFTATNTTTSPISGIITVSPTFIYNGVSCVGPSTSFSFGVNPLAEVNQPNNLIFCTNDTVPTIPFTTSNSTGTTTFSWTNDTPSIGLSATGNGAVPSFTAINSSTSPIIATITITPSYTDGGTSCNGPTKTFTITVNPAAHVVQPSDLTFCHNAVVPTINFTTANTNGTTTYTWTSDNSSIGILASGTATIPTFTTSNTTSQPITATITVTPSYSNGSLVCTGSAKTFTITVNPIGEVLQPNPIEVCSGATIPDIQFGSVNTLGTTIYSWTNTNSNIGIGSTGSGNIPSFTSQNSTTSQITGTVTVTPTFTYNGVGCTGAPKSFVININASPNGTLTGSTDLCVNATPPLLTFTGTSGTAPFIFTYTLNNGTSQTISTTGGNSITLAVPTSAQGIFTYELISIQDSNTVACTKIVSQTAIVQVFALPTISTEPLATQSICVGGTVSALTVAYTGGTGTATYQWYSHTSASNSGGTLIAGATQATFTPPVFTSVGTLYYYCVVSLSGNGCNATTSQVAEINVVADPVISSQPIANQSLCQGTTPTDLSVTVTGGIGSYSYQWYAATSATGTGTPILNATNSNYSPDSTSVGTTYYYCVINQSGIGCSVTSAVAEVIVAAAPTITSQPIGSSICIGGTPSTLSISYANGTGTASYQWYSNTSNSTAVGTPVGTNSSTYIPSASTVGILYYYCVVTFSSGGCTSVTSDTAEVNINTLPTISTEPLATQSICLGGTVSALTVAYSGGAGTATYQWYSHTSASNSGGTLIAGATQASFDPPLFTSVGTFYYYCVVSLSGNGCNATTSQVAEINVVADPVITLQPIANQSLCQGTTPTDLSVTVTGGIGSYSYQWYTATSGTGTGTPILNATNSNYTPDTTSVGTTYYYCVINQSGIGCSVTSAVAEVIIVPAPTIITQPIGSSVCIGGIPSTLSISYANGTGTASYQWYSNTSNSTAGGTPVGTNSSTYIPSASTVGTLYYYCVVTFSSGGCTSVTSDTAEVIINQIPSISNVILISCSGDTITHTPQNGNGNTVPNATLYTWGQPTINPTGAITGETAQTTPIADFQQTLANATNQIATATYILTPISGICTGSTFTIEVTVYPKPTVIFSSTNQTICNDTSTSEVTLSSSNTGTITYEWTATVPTGITGAQISGTNTIPIQLLSNTTNAPLTVTYAVFATFNYNGNQCIGPVANYSITVNPTLQTSSILSNYNGYGVSFAGASNGSINLTVVGGSGTYTFVWVDALGNQISTNEDVTNLTAGNYQVTINDGYCTPTVLNFTITEPPEILFESDPLAQINLNCFGDSNGALGVIITQESVAPYTYQLFNSLGTLVASITNSTDLTPQFTGLVADTYTFTIIDANGGTKSLTGLIVTQPNDMVIVAATTPITCYGANNASITLTVTGGTGPYTGAWDNLATGLSQTNLSAGTYTITVTDSKGCQKPITVVIPEAPVFMVNPIATNITCHGAHDGSIQLNLVGGQAPLSLTWSDGSTAGLTRNNLGPGTYTATISDGTPCFITRTFIIVDPQVLVIGANVLNATNCTNANSGTIDLNVSGGVPPFNFVWSNGANTEDLTNIIAGNYAVVVTDANGCSKSSQYVVTRPSPIVLNVATQTEFNCQAKTVVQNFTAQSTGGAQPITYSWSSGTVSGNQNQNMSTNLNGTIQLTATDAIGCTNNYTFDVNLPTLGNVGFGFTASTYQTYGFYSINDPIQFTSAITGDYVSLNWNFGDGQFSTDLNPIHSYSVPGPYVVTLSVTYPFGCVYQKVISIIVTEGYRLIVPNAFTPNTDGLNELFLPKYIGLTELEFNVYDTWGELIYSEQGDVLSGWNGTINGVEAENGNYYYTLSGKTFYGTIITRNGPFVLIK
jgi:large repetitive protein